MRSNSELAAEAMKALGFKDPAGLTLAQEQDFRAYVWTLRREDQAKARTNRVITFPMSTAVDATIQTAKHNQRNESPLEELLLLAMNARSLLIGEFKTQLEVGPYRLDFAFPRAKLCVETDGRHHREDPGQVARDQRRTSYLSKLGWQVIRFTWKQVRNSPDECCERIIAVYSALLHQRRAKEAWE